MFDKELFAERLRMERARLHISQQELEKAAGLGIGTVHKYECCESIPSAKALAKLASYLGSTPNDLLGFEVAK